MRPNFLKTSVAVWVYAAFAGSSAFAADWNGSYSANEECYCVGAIPADVSMTIVPTPIGGQAISQVCARLGKGPALTSLAGVFNHPVYADAQCGNGPFTSSVAEQDPSCVGSLDGKSNGSDSCQVAGPQWNLSRAFSKKHTPVASAAKPPEAVDSQPVKVATSNKTATILDKPIVNTLTIESTDAATNEQKTVKATVIRSASTASRKLNNSGSSSKSAVQALSPFAGKKVSIEGQRYLQAHSGIPANGGAPGSRIVLDGLVFLRDDGSINPIDLLREKKIEPVQIAQKESEPAVAAAIGQEKDPSNLKIPVTPGSNDASIDVSRAAKAAADQAKIDEQAQALTAAKLRLQHQAYQKAQARYAEEQAEKQRLAKASKAQDALKESTAVGSDTLLVTGETPEEKKLESVAETAKQVKPQAQLAKTDASAQSTVAASTSISALRLPKAVRASSRNFSYLEAMPVSYDVGGNGVLLEGSAASHSRFQYLGRIGITGDYQELMVGAGYFLTPAAANRLTVVLLAGLEYGNFELTDTQPAIAVDFDDSGYYIGAETRMVINNKFELKAGVGYGSFFEGDASVFGGGYYHINNKLDLVTRFEVGDNDLLGIGVRFYY